MTAILEWALVDGEPVSAASMVGLEPGWRPAAVCPCCGEPVVWKASDRGLVTPHVAHAPGSLCPSSNPETAEHLNAKLRLASALRDRGEIVVDACCPDGHLTRRVMTFGHDEVQPEYRVGSRRPDVALLSGGVVTWAIEVRQTHAVDSAKASDLETLNVCWVEFAALDVLRWDGSGPLCVLASSPELFADCEPCKAADERALVEQLRREREDAIREYPRLRHEREQVVRRLMENPPAWHIAVAVAMEGNPGRAVVGMVSMHEGRRPRDPCVVDHIGSGGEGP